jgi:hypothetical protein
MVVLMCGEVWGGCTEIEITDIECQRVSDCALDRAAAPTPTGNDTHKDLLTTQHDEGHTLCTCTFTASFEGPYEDSCGYSCYSPL